MDENIIKVPEFQKNKDRNESYKRYERLIECVKEYREEVEANPWPELSRIMGLFIEAEKTIKKIDSALMPSAKFVKNGEASFVPSTSLFFDRNNDGLEIIYEYFGKKRKD